MSVYQKNLSFAQKMIQRYVYVKKLRDGTVQFTNIELSMACLPIIGYILVAAYSIPMKNK